MKHIWEKHKAGECDHEGSCPVCDGGLAICTVCGLTEGSLTTDCPEKPSYAEYGDKVYAGELDYIKGQGWIQKVSVHRTAMDAVARTEARYKRIMTRMRELYPDPLYAWTDGALMKIIMAVLAETEDT